MGLICSSGHPAISAGRHQNGPDRSHDPQSAIDRGHHACHIIEQIGREKADHLSAIPHRPKLPRRPRIAVAMSVTAAQ